MVFGITFGFGNTKISKIISLSLNLWVAYSWVKGDTQAGEKKIARVPSATQNKTVDRIPGEQLVVPKGEGTLCREAGTCACFKGLGGIFQAVKASTLSLNGTDKGTEI